MRRRRLPSLSFLPILILLAGPALGTLPVEASESAVVQEILDGNELFIDDKTAKVKQKAVAPRRSAPRTVVARSVSTAAPPAASTASPCSSSARAAS